jgi:hypothetical protein
MLLISLRELTGQHLRGLTQRELARKLVVSFVSVALDQRTKSDVRRRDESALAGATAPESKTKEQTTMNVL